MRIAKSLDDVNIILKDLQQWRDKISNHDQDFHGFRIKNASAGVDPNDYVIMSQLPPPPTPPPPEQDHFYTIVFSTTGPISTGTQISAPFIVGKGREGVPYAVQVASTVAPSSGFLAVNLTINGKQLLKTDLVMNISTTGPVASSQFVAGAVGDAAGTGTFKIGYQTIVLPTCSAAGGASLVTIQLIVKRVKQSLVGK